MLKADALGFVVRSRFKQNAEEEKASIFHTAKDLSNAKKKVTQLRVNGVIESDHSKIEAEVLQYYYALFNGHHDCNLVDTGFAFVPNYDNLPKFLQFVGMMDSG